MKYDLFFQSVQDKYLDLRDLSRSFPSLFVMKYLVAVLVLLDLVVVLGLEEYLGEPELLAGVLLGREGADEVGDHRALVPHLLLGEPGPKTK